MRQHVWDGSGHMLAAVDSDGDDDSMAESVDEHSSAFVCWWWVTCLLMVIRQVCCCGMCLRRLFPHTRCGRDGCFGVVHTLCALGCCWCRSRPYRSAMCAPCEFLACVPRDDSGGKRTFLLLWSMWWSLAYLWCTIQAVVVQPTWLMACVLHLTSMVPTMLCNAPVGGVRGAMGSDRLGDSNHDDAVPPMAAGGSCGKFATCFQSTLVTCNLMLLIFLQRHVPSMAWPVLAWPIAAVCCWYTLVVGVSVVVHTEDVEAGSGGDTHALCSDVMLHSD